MIREKAALAYHSQGRKGKIEVVTSKPCATQRDLSLAYTPGVAEPCNEIVKDPVKVFEYTARGNLVAVITNGTAVLGLGNIGPKAAKPVMEGKAVLFKKFADIDVFDLELDTLDPDKFVEAVKLLEPTFGGINLEDIKAPECFYIESRLKEEMGIPVFHDDQHGTAIISAAALLNALEIAGKDIGEVAIVVSGAGAAGIACSDMYVTFGAKKERIIMCDSKGVIYRGRKKGMNPYKERYARETNLRTLAEAMVGADVFIGVSSAGIVSGEMVKSMAKNPIVFAMANPDPEISWEEAMAARGDVIMATGRSDYPNQVNNVLGFPYIFRGALDVGARSINEEMKKAASLALAELAKEGVPDSVARAYGAEALEFGRNYIIPKPFDHRALLRVAPAVARAAMESGVARIPLKSGEGYIDYLEAHLSKSRYIMRSVIHKAQRSPRRIVFPEGGHEKILRACQILLDEKIAFPILLGNERTIKSKIKKLHLDLGGTTIIDPARSDKLDSYRNEFYKLRRRKGITFSEVKNLLNDMNYFGSMMVRMGDADGLVSGLTQQYPETIRTALQTIGIQENLRRVSGIYFMVFRNKLFFFADATVNIDPTSEDLAEIAICSAETARRFDVEPKIAFLSFSNFGSSRHPFVDKVREAVRITRERAPDLVVDGEMQADTAVVTEIVEKTYPFCKIKGGANVLIFPDLQSANISYKLLQRLGGAETIGPILMGMRKPVQVLQRGGDVDDIVNVAAIAVVDAQWLEYREKVSTSPKKGG